MIHDSADNFQALSDALNECVPTFMAASSETDLPHINLHCPIDMLRSTLGTFQIVDSQGRSWRIKISKDNYELQTIIAIKIQVLPFHTNGGHWVSLNIALDEIHLETLPREISLWDIIQDHFGNLAHMDDEELLLLEQKLRANPSWRRQISKLPHKEARQARPEIEGTW